MSDPVPPYKFAPENLRPELVIASRTDAKLLLGSILLFAPGLVAFVIGSLSTDDQNTALPVPLVLGMALAAIGVCLQIVWIHRVSYRVRPGRIGPFSRWWQQTMLGALWQRPDVLRYAGRVLRTRT